MTPTRPTRTARLIALALAALCAAVPAGAEGRRPDPAGARVLAAATAPHRPQPIREAARVQAHAHRAELSQAPPSATGCASRVVRGGIIGAAVGVAAAVGLLYQAGGSDSAGQIVKVFALIGAGAGLVGGGIFCES